MDRCSACSGRYKCIPGDGSLRSKIVAIGERPGQQEQRMGRVFVGDAGRELDDHYLLLAGLGRDDLYITNVVKCGEDRNKKPTQKEIDACSELHLRRELNEINPELVILMGATACSLVEDLELDIEHGIPRWARIFDWEGWVVGMYHPAAGMHNTNLMIPLRDDWKSLGEWWRGDHRPHAIEVEETHHTRIKSIEQAESYVDWYRHRFFSTPIVNVGADSESHAGEFYSWQICASVGYGQMIHLTDHKVSSYIAEWLKHCVLCGRIRFIFHNAPADLPLFEKVLGMSLDGHYIDTMQIAYLFQNLPQGLKALAYRLLHKRRRSWDQVVGPPSREVLRTWLLGALEQAESEAETIPQFGKRGQPIKPKIIKSGWERVLRGITMHMSKGVDYDPWKRITPVMEEYFGECPKKGIKWVDEQDQINYACGDASDALELALLFEQMMKEIVNKEWSIHEDDQDRVTVGG